MNLSIVMLSTDRKADEKPATKDQKKPGAASTLLKSTLKKKSSFLHNHDMVKDLILKDKLIHQALSNAINTLDGLEKDKKFVGVDEEREEKRKMTILMSQVLDNNDKSNAVDKNGFEEDSQAPNGDANRPSNKSPEINNKSVVSKPSVSKRPSFDKSGSLIILSPSPKITKKGTGGLTSKPNIMRERLTGLDKANPLRKPINGKPILQALKNSNVLNTRSTVLNSNLKPKTIGSSTIVKRSVDLVKKLNTTISRSPSLRDSKKVDDNKSVDAKNPVSRTSIVRNSKIVKDSSSPKPPNSKNVVKKSVFARSENKNSGHVAPKTKKIDVKGTKKVETNVSKNFELDKIDSDKSFEEHESKIINSMSRESPVGECNPIFEEVEQTGGDQMMITENNGSRLPVSIKLKSRREKENTSPLKSQMPKAGGVKNSDLKAKKDGQAATKLKPSAIEGNKALGSQTSRKPHSQVIFEEMAEEGAEYFSKPALDQKSTQPSPLPVQKAQNKLVPTVSDINVSADFLAIGLRNQNQQNIADIMSIERLPSKKLDYPSPTQVRHNPLKGHNYVQSLKDLEICQSTVTEDGLNQTVENLSMEKTKFVDVNMQSTVLFDVNVIAPVMLPSELMDNKPRRSFKKPINVIDTVIFENTTRLTQNQDNYSLLEKTVLVEDPKVIQNQQVDKQLWVAIQDFIKRCDFNTAFQLGANLNSDESVTRFYKMVGCELQNLKPFIKKRFMDRIDRIAGFSYRF